MFAETIIASVALGAIASAVVVYLVLARPAEQERDALGLQQAERRWERETDAREYEAFRNRHRGTPYLSPPMTELEAVLVGHQRLADVLADNDRWSVKAPPELRSVS